MWTPCTVIASAREKGAEVATETVASYQTTPKLPTASTVEPRRAKPVQVWAGIGVAWLVVLAFEYGKWLALGRAHANTIGASSAPTWMQWTVHGSEVLYSLGGLTALYFLTWKPWRRTGRISFDGAMVIAFLSMWMISDAWATYFRPFYIYNSVALNLGCPQCQLPGSFEPHWGTMYLEPIGLLGLYAGGLTLGVIFGCWVARCAQRRWPRMGKIGTFFILLPAMVFSDMVMEIPMQAAGWWTYANAPGPTLFRGHYFEYPICEGILMWMMWAGWVLVRHYHNDRGETVIERGLEEMRVSLRRKNLLRVLAVIGMINTIAVAAYHLPGALLVSHAHDYPTDVLKRPYFLHGQCGPGTNQACAGQDIPLAGSSSAAHATPRGTLVAPAGLPRQVPPYGRSFPSPAR
jgi:Spirocyclase AveC-like